LETKLFANVVTDAFFFKHGNGIGTNVTNAKVPGEDITTLGTM